MTKELRGLVNRFAPAPLTKLKPKRADRKATKKVAKQAAAATPIPRRAAGSSYRRRWASAS
jgi:hypothetical protein